MNIACFMKNRKSLGRLLLLLLCVSPIIYGMSQNNTFQAEKVPNFRSLTWIPEIGKNFYRNPVIFADYSDPDVIRVGKDYYLVASSFECVPGLPILHSIDLIHWEILCYALPRQPPFDYFSKPHYSEGAWAPAIRYHNHRFYIFYPDPDRGIYMINAARINGPWSAPLLVEKGAGIIDPCPFWDEDGKAYLAHAYAGSRAGIKSMLVIERMKTDGTGIVGAPVLVYDGHNLDPTVEGPKIYKRNGYYYLFAPAGGVTDGWQLVLRSHSIWGPYERRIVLSRGKSSINGPHQGAWVNTPDGGQDWFIHFQDKGPYGRVIFLEPMVWTSKGWPVIGTDSSGSGTGTPVSIFRSPLINKASLAYNPQEGDEFNGTQLSLAWQWPANPAPWWAFLNNAGYLHYNCVLGASDEKNLRDFPAILMQKFPSDSFYVTVRLRFHPASDGDKTGLVVMGNDYALVGLKQTEKGVFFYQSLCLGADKGQTEKELWTTYLPSQNWVYLRVHVSSGALCRFSYSVDGKLFTDLPFVFHAVKSMWTGAKVGIFCRSSLSSNDAGFADIDYFRFTSEKDDSLKIY